MRFTLAARQLSHIGSDARRIAEPGDFEISLGGKQPGFSGPLDASTTGVLTRSLKLTGSPRSAD